ncbi:hypothetical protein, partial [Lysinibacillus sphaericus]|uniref:hypothetical protein n=1 Tax=Lysinibacillus sphaericus TaxID=1421 RepID=UPI001C3F89E4
LTRGMPASYAVCVLSRGHRIRYQQLVNPSNVLFIANARIDKFSIEQKIYCSLYFFSYISATSFVMPLLSARGLLYAGTPQGATTCNMLFYLSSLQKKK